ncbi:hypothetical protein BDQ94DRAFT_154791 [Aspergillus welwitschiae]|uniref:Uncharacterized protein n=1 Tax=Aspergillus welwitschiae TaxID=1341132 RepID=A0A3F3PJ72_9EURO|nr:hypothetical protein BDQ94DRAFT_154791 [Aspergillus welwitschiae]RDH26938.1 hypothetical protein BDQ94DRAFT_154791 [Aspergillus welwitschiae]
MFQSGTLLRTSPVASMTLGRRGPWVGVGHVPPAAIWGSSAIHPGRPSYSCSVSGQVRVEGL